MNIVTRDESEEEFEEGHPEQEVPEGNPEEDRLLRAISKIGKRPKLDVPTLTGSMN